MDAKQRGSRKDDMVVQAIIFLIVSIVVLVVVTALLCEKFGIYGLIFPATIIAVIIVYSRYREGNLVAIQLDPASAKFPVR
jgi:hypothetical protein